MAKKLKTRKRRVKSPKKKQQEKLDALWRVLVKKKALERCERCGEKKLLNAHHLFSRRYLCLRWYLDNGMALCVSCHFWAHQNPLEFSRWFRLVKGTQREENLILIRNTTVKVDLDEIEHGLNRIENLILEANNEANTFK